MASKSTKAIDDLVEKAAHAWRVASPALDGAKAVISPLDTYFKSVSNDAIFKYASENLQKCVALSRLMQDYMSQFTVSGKPKDAGYYLETYTGANVGDSQANKAALAKLRELEDFLYALRQLAEAAEDLTAAAFTADVQNIKDASPAMYMANTQAKKRANNGFNNTIRSVGKVLPPLQKAIEIIEAM